MANVVYNQHIFLGNKFLFFFGVLFYVCINLTCDTVGASPSFCLTLKPHGGPPTKLKLNLTMLKTSTIGVFA